MLESWALGPLEVAINQYIQLDSDAKYYLKPLDGRVIQLTLTPMAFCFYFKCMSKNIELTSTAPDVVDAHIIASPLALATMDHKHIHIEGDTEVALEFNQLFQKIDIDWEEHLSQLCGDNIAHIAGHVFKKARGWFRRSGKQLQENVTEYIQEEARQLPPREEVQDFFQSVDELRLASDRLEAHIQRILQTKNL